MTEIGTLKELGVKPGDVVRGVVSGNEYAISNEMMCGGTSVKQAAATYQLISRAADTLKIWRDMTPEEKGALLLARHEKKDLQEYHFGRKVWTDHFWNYPLYEERAYRVKPEPKVETVTLYGLLDSQWGRSRGYDDTHKITFNTLDGKPDCASIKMEKL